MDEPDLKPLMGARLARTSEVIERGNAMTAQDTDNWAADEAAERDPSDDLGRLFPREGVQHPISESAAWALCAPFVGLVRCNWRVKRVDTDLFEQAIKTWWECLRKARLPEERLTCERMINALGLANGMDNRARASELAAENVERFMAHRKEMARVRSERKEAACVDAWRDFRSVP
ncbi:hypothetical protein OC539_25400 [Paracoccus denitrificans]|jgi:hypothetical protein|uniref:Uncharacterized protein n=2 Tax=Paracoccus denitrificans TaxID=266 RepID=A1AYW6_PARDP|nr:hypothetical protein [Paracoccus denitrificans]ABL68460.1 hypothetical protein Pden_0346 [Paracoccus denitrificans PD1222]MBB4630283.1 hypothetical protein [Paracoccus denitrificans]MCU7431644.1 hypothetical protein [Paracoccus denitrificans]QAR26537.1 hypothetical protein EO213_09645 [Paracoccus denitrificans]UPV95476.1 hypothetical protein M0K93_02480 [Paracoccus denitrificans]